MRSQSNLVSKVLLYSVIMADYIALGIALTTFPALMLRDGSKHFCSLSPFETYQFTLLGFLLSIYPLGQFFGAAILGKLSDSWGRKPLLLLSIAGTLLACFVSGVAIEIGSFVLLFGSRLIAGAFAGNLAIAQAAVVDISDEHSKGKNFVILNATIATAWTIGPSLGGMLSDCSLVPWFSYATPYWLACLLLAFIWVVMLLSFQETLQNPQTKKADIYAHFRQLSSAFRTQKLRRAYLIWGLFNGGWWLFESYLPTYLLEQFNFSSRDTGFFLAFMGVGFAVTALGFVRPLTSRFSPEVLVKVFVGICALAVMLFAGARNSLQLHAAILLFVFSLSFAIPSLMTCISNLARDDEQGQTMGVISSIQALVTVSAMLIGGPLFVLSKYATLMLATLFFGICCFLSVLSF